MKSSGGERLSALVPNEAALRAATVILLLAPSPPLLFMGEEWGALEPFPYFCDFEPELAEKVRAGRRREFAHFAQFQARREAQAFPDPGARSTYDSAKLNWQMRREPRHATWLDYYRRLLVVRRRDIVPLIPAIRSGRCIKLTEDGAFAVDWALQDGSRLHLLCNLRPSATPIVGRAAGRTIFATHPAVEGAVARNQLEAWSVTWLLERGDAT
jgi:1,4-alpha-glucan branching enzyme